MTLYIPVYLLSMIIGTTSGAFVEFLVEPGGPTRNDILLECYVGTGVVPATFQFFDRLDGQTPTSIFVSNMESPRLEYTVDPTSERFIRCISDGDPSDLLAIGAVPEVMNHPDETINVYRDATATLTCPFVLGNLRDYLEPYDISWELRENGTRRTVTDTNSLSSENRELSVPISDSMDTRMYQCSFTLSRCTRFDENNDVEDRCQIEGVFMGPLTSFNVFEPSQLITSPGNVEASVGEVATLTCSAFGSFITISWQIDNSPLLCNESSCDVESVFVRQENSSYTDRNRNVTILSTLEIDTVGLADGTVVLIACVLNQQLGDMDVQGNSNPTMTFSSFLTVESRVSNSTTLSVSDSTTLSVSDSTTTTASITIGIIIGFSVTVITLFGVIIALIWKIATPRNKQHVIQTQNERALIDTSLQENSEPYYEKVDHMELEVAIINSCPAERVLENAVIYSEILPETETVSVKDTCSDTATGIAVFPHPDTVMGNSHETTTQTAKEDPSPEVCTAITTYSNDAYGLSIAKVDDEHSYQNVRLLEATMMFYTEPTSTSELHDSHSQRSDDDLTLMSSKAHEGSSSDINSPCREVETTTTISSSEAKKPCSEAEIPTTSNEAYNQIPAITTVDEEHSYKNVCLLEATMMYYTETETTEPPNFHSHPDDTMRAGADSARQISIATSSHKNTNPRALGDSTQRQRLNALHSHCHMYTHETLV